MTDNLRKSALVLRQHDIAGFRATQVRQCRTQSAGNGKPFSRTATPHWRIGVAPFGQHHVGGALEYHRSYPPGKLKVTATKALATQRDLALAYSPGNEG